MRRERQDLSPGWGQAAPAGGASLPGWTSCAAPAEFEKRSGLPGVGPWTFSALACPGKYPQRCDLRGAVELEPRWVSVLGESAPVRFGSVRLRSENLRRRHSDDGSPSPGALRGETSRAAVGLGHYLQLVFKCLCCFTFPKDATLCFIFVNFVLICIHRGLPSQTHHCWASTGADGYFRYQSTK